MRIAIAGATGLVGHELTARARAEGHEVVELSRARGVDLRQPLDAAVLDGVDAVVDVTEGGVKDREGATAFFTDVATHLGEAATAAGAARTVVLSIIGVDRTPHDDYFVAKLAHEEVTLTTAPGPVVLRAAQFHEFAGQVIGWGRDGDVTHVQEMPMQPVALSAVVRALLDLATGADTRTHVELAGPQHEDLVDLARRQLAHDGLDLTVVPEPVSAEMAAGALRAGPGTDIAGPDWATWLAGR